MKQDAGKESRGGYTIQELVDMWQKYIVEIGVGVVFALTAIFSLMWGGMMLVLSILLCMILGIIGAVFPDTARTIFGKMFGLINLEEKVSPIISLCIGVMIAIFLPCVIFAAIGFMAGSNIHYNVYRKSSLDTTLKPLKKMDKKAVRDDEQRPPDIKAS